MLRAAVAGSRVIDPAGLRLRRGDQLGHRIHLQVRVHDEHVGTRGDARHRHERRQRVVLERLVQPGADDMRGRREKPGIAVGLRLGDVIGADGAAGAGPVLHEGRAAELRAQLRREDARRHVGETAGAERYHDADGLRRPGLRGGLERAQQCCDNGNEACHRYTGSG